MQTPHETTDHWPLAGAAHGQIVVIARWRPVAGTRARILAALPDLVDSSRAEPGCLGYQVLPGPDSADGDIVLIERYADRDAFEAHRTSAHFRRIVQGDIAPYLLDREVTVCTAD
ncbi:putative quinol monooxygenase [Streptomyces sp. NPDC060194]|uniref:putative quinol monooxygenase n=1 Tax=Streptomyces sp. NPDC060194 TaxID=3347069 RepID=UPI003656AA5D